MTAAERASELFAAAFGADPETVWAAPGRVNLIGEHTDYNDGFVVPFAIEQRTAVAAGRGPAGAWSACSESEDATVHFGLDDLVPGAVTGWTGYVAGIVAVLRDAGVAVPGARLAICSDVPRGSGLSSSAALECAVLATLVQLAGDDLAVEQWPALARRAENEFAGVPCGILDQAASTLCTSDHALFLDCRSGGTEQVPFDPAAAGLSIVVINTHAEHANADGEYANRRASCEAAAAALGIRSLRDVEAVEALADLDDALLRRRAHHVVSENRRVHDTIAALRAGRLAAVGELLTASHVSLRDDFEVSCPELDLAVSAATTAGALGARMVGGGFGGCAIALVPTGLVGAVAESVTAAFETAGFARPSVFTALPSAGVHRVR